MLKIISCAGFGNTGSSIVTDFFGEFSIINTIGGSAFEFFFLHENDGIIDLEKALLEGHRLKTDLAIKRFIKLVYELNYCNPSGPNYKDFFNDHFIEYTLDYLTSLNILKWENGWWHRSYDIDHFSVSKKIKKIIDSEKFKYLLKKSDYKLYESDGWRPIFCDFSEQYYCHITEEKFVEKTKIYLERLFLEMAEDNEYLLFDQLFPSNVDSNYLKYFDFAKVIIIDRDPRDLYFMNKVFWGAGYIPTENVDVFIKWYKTTRNNIYYSDNIMKINFEDMIFKQDETQQRLCDFVGLDINQHDKKRTKLFIEKSETNTQVFNRFVIDDSEFDSSLKKDIIKIENELASYLYCFKNYVGDTVLQSYCIENIYKKIKKGRNSLIFIIYTLIMHFLRVIYHKIKRSK